MSPKVKVSAKVKPRVVKYPIILCLGISFIAAGMLVYYFWGYKNIQELPAICFIVITAGWFGVFYNILPAMFNRSHQREIQWLPQSGFNKLSIILLLALTYESLQGAMYFEQLREQRILTEEPTQTTTALITLTELRVILRGGSSHIAHIRYIANKDTINQEAPNDELQFETGRFYSVRYSVEFPQMFRLYPK